MPRFGHKAADAKLALYNTSLALIVRALKYSVQKYYLEDEGFELLR